MMENFFRNVQNKRKDIISIIYHRLKLKSNYNEFKRDIHVLDKIIGTPPFLVLYLKKPTRAAPIVGGLAVFFEF